MSLLLAAVLSSAGVSGNADICRANMPNVDPEVAPAVLKYDIMSMGARYIPPFVNTPEAHAQTRVTSGIMLVASRGMRIADSSIFVRYVFVKSQLCERDIQSVRPPVGQPLDSPTT